MTNLGVRGAGTLDNIPEGGTEYFLTDQLGSTSVVTNGTNGAVVGTQGYYPFGETRYSAGSLFTDRLYTGQQEDSYIKLMNYRSRWYDASLGRFIQPDSIIPNSSPQSLNRYSYVNNDPINYNDPSGHFTESACANVPLNMRSQCIAGSRWGDQSNYYNRLDGCSQITGSAASSCSTGAEIQYTIKFMGATWDSYHERDAVKAVTAAGNSFARIGETAYSAFRRVFGRMKFMWGNNDTNGGMLPGWCATCGGGYSAPSQPGLIGFFTSAGYTGDQFSALVTHELGHKFIFKYGFGSMPSSWNNDRNEILNGPDVSDTYSTWRHASSTDWDETLPDIFTAWVFNQWNTDPDYAGFVANAIIDMNNAMSFLR